MILVAAAGGGALGLKTTQVAGGDGRLALALVIVLEIGCLVTLPAWTTIVLGVGSASPIAEVVRTVVFAVLLPLLAGVVIRRSRPTWIGPLERALAWVSTIGLAVVLVLIVARHAGILADSFASGLPLVAIILVLGCLAAGAAVEGPAPGARATVSLVTAGRANVLALAVAQASFPGRPGVAVASVVVGLASTDDSSRPDWPCPSPDSPTASHGGDTRRDAIVRVDERGNQKLDNVPRKAAMDGATTDF